MKDTTKSLMIILILVAIAIAILYFTDFKINKDKELTNITIYATEDGKKIITGYEIKTTNETITGNTTYTPQIKVVPLEEITVKNINIKDQNYYVEERKFNLTKDTNRINIQLKKPKPIQIEYTYSNPIQVNLTSNYAKNIDICLLWSNSYVFVKPQNLNKIDLKESIDCYDGDFTLDSSTETINIEFSKIKPITEEDFIQLIIISDEDFENEKIVKIK